MERKLKVGILGATGMVGPRFVQLLDNHPWFEIEFLAASEKSSGKPYCEACSWKLPTLLPECVKHLLVRDPEPGFDAPVVFSGLDSRVAGSIEEAFAKAGYAVISNSSNHRMDEDVPLLIPEINPEHLQLVDSQRKRYKGFIVTNPNCSTITLSLALAPLEKQFGIESACVTTLQAVSGAGYPGVPSLDIVGNIIPFIANEEEKIETETRKIFGRVAKGKIQFHPMKLSAQTTRVAVLDGHTETVAVKLRAQAGLNEIKEAFKNYRALPQELQLPTAPARPIVLKDEADRPQPRLDVEIERGMATVVGRVRECPIFDAKFVILGHNTIRGAAGAAILNAELLKAQGYFD
ncbi:MAG: aspartate-semialdehyde dehydrogenase [Candidatus Fraserbacteria bacterium RBG_16_55_9]|uniref:Aspartate-semialdehyde dehydrogenase n=1 Tax=Fraserbacteria sp. (strain RBG_16_55_9) TaxID=1817864 RepID=A0A1F5UVA0_FRAXR|nr:MAG: aspartate-semialdehyde dehydrogenase [Candidatus Fraserbacteria bacterium RBG_16_55_9]